MLSPTGLVVGFTGTQRGMTAPQFHSVAALLRGMQVREVHHGDCIGADADFDRCVRWLFGGGMRVVIHPPTNPKKRAYCAVDPSENLPALPYLIRNQAIVSASDAILACPFEDQEQIRSGTWSTVRRARTAGKHVTVVRPDGSLALVRH